MRRSIIIYIVFLAGCTVDPPVPAPSLPQVSSTTSASNVTSTTAMSGGIILSSGGDLIQARGVCWSNTQNPTISNPNNITNEQGGLGSFVSSISGLSAGVTYFVRSYATNSVGTSYGPQISFTTSTIPTVSTNTVINVSNSSVTTGGNVTNNGGSNVSARGVCWSFNPLPNINSNPKTVDGTGIGSFTSNISGLSSGQIYYVRAYATNSVGTGYGSQISFTTLAAPSVATSLVTNVTGISASSGGNVGNDGGAIVNARGVCWNTSSGPTIALSTKTIDGSGTGNFISTVTGLTNGRTYYLRAYATNSVGTSYGTEYSFTTLNIPSVTTTSISSITNNSAISGGNVSLSGGSTVTSRGVCWNTSSGPTIALSTKTIDGSGTGNFISTVTGLANGTTYYLRAYATNSVGTSYGTEYIFTTLNIPTVTTTSISSITINSAISGGNVLLSGGSTVTSRGVCWSLTMNPTIALSTKTVNGSGTGVYSSSITGLARLTTYYVRAYATNSVGTAYGANISFRTN